MIRGHEVDRATSERTPQLFTIFPLSDRWRALEVRRAISNFFRSKREVMGTGLDRHTRTSRLSRLQRHNRIGRRKMDDVHMRSEFARQFQEQLNRLIFPL